jgi:parallel beta-helix repeat protein
VFAIQAAVSRVSIRNTIINGSKGRGIALFVVSDAVEILNTVVNACSTTALFMEGLCNPTVINNVFSNSGYYGMEIADNCNPLFVNNIVVGNGRGGLRASRVCAPTLNYNDVFGNGMRNGSDNLNYINAGTGGTFLIAENSLEVDPLLNPDFTLGPGSPCIDAGHPDILDVDGTRSDMGAFGGPGGGSLGALSAGPTTAFLNR